MEINDHVDHQRWLIDNGFINDLHKDNLYMYGTIVHKDVRAVEVHIETETKNISYEIFVDSGLQKKIDKYNRLVNSTKIFDLWLFRRLLRKEGNLNFKSVLIGFVKTYLGPKWNVNVVIKSIKEYEEGYNKEDVDTNRQPDPK